MEVKTYNISEDIFTLSVTADRFPEGIQDAYKNLEKSIPDFKGRQCFGVTEQVDGNLRYKACAKELEPGEGKKYNLPVYIIPQGSYLYLTLHDWNAHMDLFKKYFDELLAHPATKKGSIGLEYYSGTNDVMLMVQEK